ncbi:MULTISPECIES: 2'-5' RNA ligase family protein [unclassified Crossiella]|uniref:2'-5' RNA ligase family protein n=1 Tax=unclassified Crossiella TaxID=2620835 RepID=UPI001FFE4A8C|nr:MULTISPECIES: 2'-5' RNA ligase family protein [unclassified Crossiella]MCK2237796.1 2'-5' RNA ligase family protein [Crossiella sp. S99.2]MCK2255082.1 2'-5' RNA ligase family protein [Crossiella sp. S99.1]
MADALEMFFDPEADTAVRGLWRRLEQAGAPSLATLTHRRHQPHISLAVAAQIPAKARAELRADLALLAMPGLWLHNVGAFATSENVLMLAAVVDAELLAVHSAVHDVLAGRVKHPSAYYLPGSWVPHCTLAQGVTGAELAAGFAAVHPYEPIRASVAAIGVVDTRTGEVDELWSA